jgi:hypothetical protein
VLCPHMNIRKALLTLAIISAASGSSLVAAQEPVGKLLRYGVFEMIGPAQGPWKTGSVKQTSVVAARTGERFGIEFEVSGIAEHSVTISATLQHPPIQKPDGVLVTNEEATMGPFEVRDGKIKTSYGFSFDHPYEIVPGEWTLAISYQGRVVVRKSFEVMVSK